MSDVETPQRLDLVLDQPRELGHRQQIHLGGEKYITAYPDLLPPEILAHIFLLTQSVVSGTFRPYCSPDITWIWVSHVCRYWRAAALECPALWADITNVKKDLSDTMLLRSKQTLLNVRYSHVVVYRYDISLLPSIFPQLGRIRILHLHNLSCDMSPLTERMPFLQELVLTSNDGTLPLPDGFLGGDTPPLTRLDLYWFWMKASGWKDLPIHFRLVHLHLVSGNGTPLLVSEQELWTSLATMTALESLTMRGILPRDGHAPPQIRFPMCLQHLRYLDANDGITLITRFLEKLEIPKVTQLTINTTEGHDFGVPVALPRELLRAIRNSCSENGTTVNLRPCHSIELVTNDFRLPDAYVFAFDVGFKANSFDFHLELILTDIGVSPSDYMLLFKEHIDLDTLHSLRVRHENALPSQVWNFFMSLPALERVEVHHTISSFIATLSATPLAGFTPPSTYPTTLEPSPLDWNAQLCFPALTIFKCVSVDFGGDTRVAEDLATALRKLQAHRRGRKVVVEVDVFCKSFGCSELQILEDEEIDVEWDRGPPPRPNAKAFAFEWLLEQRAETTGVISPRMAAPFTSPYETLCY